MNDNATHCCCCTAAPRALKPPENRPGLPALAYRLGTHAQFKAAMLAAIGAKPELARLTTRADDDPAIALLDGWATVLDVLTFYQERIANEGYLQTATERRSVLELARAIGYELRPGVAASAYLSFSLETAPGAPLEAKVPKGTKVQSVPGQDEKPQLFETTEELHARAEWNEMRPKQRELKWPRSGDTQTILKGTATNLKPGDVLLFVGAVSKRYPLADKWDLRHVVNVEPVYTGQAEADYTRVTWDRPLDRSTSDDSGTRLKVYALRQRASLFGHNAPDWWSLPARIRAKYPGGDGNDWPGFSLFRIAGEGLFGEDFANPKLGGEPQTRRVDPGINFPAGKLPPGTRSARWTGSIYVGKGGNLLQVTGPSEWSLWLDGELEIKDRADRGKKGASAIEEVKVEEGWHDLCIECKGLTREDGVMLEWIERGSKFEAVPEIYLDTVYPKIRAGGWVVLSGPGHQKLYRVEEMAEDAQSGFMLTAKTTRLTLGGDCLKPFDKQLRRTAVFAESEELVLADSPIETPVFGRELLLEQPMTPMAKGRRLIVGGRRVYARVVKSAVTQFAPDGGSPRTIKLEPGQTWRAAEVRGPADTARTTWRLVDDTGVVGSVVVSQGTFEWVEEMNTSEVAEVEPDATPGAAASDGTTASVRLADVLENSYVRDSVRILGNVALATHGETRGEVLGSGDAGQTFQAFQLKQTPVTHVPTAQAGGEESTLQVRVDDVLWREVPSLHDRGSKDRCYVTRLGDDGKTTVQFGDGHTGARPPTGLENIRAAYRVGLGLAGVLPAGRLSLLLTRPLGVKSVTNPLPSAGGADPEPRDQARQNTPFTVRTLGRIVSLLDFEDFARTFAGIGKAQANWVWSGSQRVVFLTVAGAGGKALHDSLAPLTDLRKTIETVREPTQPAQVGIWTPITFTLRAKVLLKDGYLQDKVYAAVRAALLDAFSFDRRAFGQPVAKSELLAAIQGVEGVQAADLDAPVFGDVPLLPARGADWSEAEGRILPAELLTLAPDGIELTEMTV